MNTVARFIFTVLILLTIRTADGHEGLCGLTHTLAPSQQACIARSDRDCPEGEIFFVRSNVQQNAVEEVCFTLLHEAADARMWAETARLASGDITVESAAVLWNHFYHSTPNAAHAELTSGILNAEQVIFGPPPLNHGSDVVNILLLDVRDDFSGSGDYVGGYFDPNDQTSSNSSNRRNIIYIDCDPVDLNSGYPEEALYTLAHELEHLLHFASDPDEDDDGDAYNPWLDEGLADLAPMLLGLGHRNFGYYLSDTSIGLDDWMGNGLAYYAKSALFVQYLYDHFGLAMITSLFEDDVYRRLESVENYLGTYTNWTLEEVYRDWVKANVSASYGSFQCISGVSPQVDISEELTLGENNFFLSEQQAASHYSSIHLYIPPIVKKYDMLDFTWNPYGAALYDINSGTFLEPSGSGEWYLDGYTGGLIFSKMNLLQPQLNWDLFFNLQLDQSLHQYEYDHDLLNTYIQFGASAFQAVNQYDIVGQQLLTSVQFRTGDDENIVLKIRRNSLDTTPVYSMGICGPTGPGWTTVDLSEENLFMENTRVYVELASNGNAVAYSEYYPLLNGGETNGMSYYSTGSGFFSRISSLILDGEPLNGNWMIRLNSADSSFTNPAAELESWADVPLYPNPFPADGGQQVSTRIYTASAERIRVEVYNLLGQRVQSVYDDIPPPGVPVTVFWDGSDLYGQPVPSGIYFIKVAQKTRNSTRRLILLR